MKKLQQIFLVLCSTLFICCGEEEKDWKKIFEGAWNSPTGSGIFYETWKINGDSLIGAGFEVSENGDTLFNEKLELFERNGELVYVAYPGNTKRVEFIGKKNKSEKYVFENKKNDFPSTIEYVFVNNKLQVNLKGLQDGVKVTEPLKMEKVK